MSLHQIGTFPPINLIALLPSLAKTRGLNGKILLRTSRDPARDLQPDGANPPYSQAFLKF
jgi:hypothetical protein